MAHTFLHKAGSWGAAAVTLHGRTRQQRYSRLADWGYITRCGEAGAGWGGGLGDPGAAERGCGGARGAALRPGLRCVSACREKGWPCAPGPLVRPS